MTAMSPTAGELAYDPSDPVFRADPYPRYAALRLMDKPLRTADGLPVLTRYADVLAAVRDRRLSSNPAHSTQMQSRRTARNEAMSMVPDGMLQIMLTADPPDHTRLRRLANRAFTPRAVERLRPWITELIDSLLDDLAAADDPDLMAHVAEPLPVYVICELLGVPSSDQDRFKPWSDAVARLIDGDADPAKVRDEGVPAILGFIQYFADLIEQRRNDPQDDLLTGLIHAEEDGDSLSLAELYGMLILLFIAGHETTTNLIGNGTLALLRNPDQYRWLREHPDDVTTAVEELLRYDSPVQLTVRTATEDVQIGDTEIPKGHSAICGLAAANRDPAFVADPERLVLARGDAMHLSFSNGMHHCLGAPLARLEGALTFQALADRFPDLALAEDPPPYREHFILRGVARLGLTGLR